MATPFYKLSEKRKQRRFSIALPSTIVSNSKNSPALRLVSRDICAGGGFYLTDSPLPIGTQVMIKMIMNLGETDHSDVTRSQINVSGTVVRADSIGMAVSFGKRYKIVAMRK